MANGNVKNRAAIVDFFFQKSLDVVPTESKDKFAYAVNHILTTYLDGRLPGDPRKLSAVSGAVIYRASEIAGIVLPLRVVRDLVGARESDIIPEYKDIWMRTVGMIAENLIPKNDTAYEPFLDNALSILETIPECKDALPQIKGTAKLLIQTYDDVRRLPSKTHQLENIVHAAAYIAHKYAGFKAPSRETFMPGSKKKPLTFLYWQKQLMWELLKHKNSISDQKLTTFIQEYADQWNSP